VNTIPLRPIAAHWTCQRDGACCRLTAAVVMTPAERDLLLARRPDIADRFTVASDGFVQLQARPCPLLATDDRGRAACTVHEVRPYSCRRFCCYRPDPASEPYEEGPDGECRNLVDRVSQSRDVRRAYALNQRRAQRWADRHGWTPT
jgi:Fe-S-cluster containining protein